MTLLSPADAAALDPVAYLRRIPPFDTLPEPLFLEAAAGIEIALFQAGTRLVAAGGEPLRRLFVIRKGAVRIEREGRVLQVLEEGEAFGYTSLLSGEATLDVVVEEDLLAYCLPASEFARLLGDARFAAHFAVGLTERLKAALEHAPVARYEPDVGVEVGQLVRRAPVWLPGDSTARDAARVMRDEHVSSVLLRCEPPGIVTDRDLRNRVLGEDRDPGEPAVRFCSRPLLTIPATTPLYEAWRTLLELGLNHLLLERDGEIVGVVTSTDLLRHSAQGPVAVLRRFERIASREGLGDYRRKVTEMASALLAAGLDAGVIAGFVAQLDATLLRRLLHLAEAALGPPPAPYAWLVFGREARREQTLPARQDGGLVHADEGRRDAAWFRALAERVESDLEAAGFPAARPERTARARCGGVSEWLRRIEETAERRPWELGPLLDLGRGAGTLDVAPLEEALAAASRRPHVARQLAAQALAVEPPSGLLLRLRGASSRVDVSRHGIAPIVLLARCLAAEAGSRARNTLERLEAARAAGLLAEDAHAALAEAFRFLLGLRLRLELRAVAAGRPPAEEVALAELTAIERTRLRESFRVIRRWQEAASHGLAARPAVAGRGAR